MLIRNTMMRWICLLLVIYVSWSLSAYAAYKCAAIAAQSGRPQLPASLENDFPALFRSQPTPLTIMGHNVMVHNKQLAYFIRQQPNYYTLMHMIGLLYQQNMFDFPITNDGFLAAANNGDHGGGYGQNTWLRDLMRALLGAEALPEMLEWGGFKPEKEKTNLAKMNSAMLRLLTEKDQIILTLQNILDPNFHKDPQNGYRNVIKIRLDIAARENGKTPTSEQKKKEAEWGHKQNDAVALTGHNILDGIRSGRVSLKTLTLDVKAEMFYLLPYFQRMGFAKMEDVGAWEERMGIRSSSLGLVLSYLERFHNGLEKKGRNFSLKERAFFQNMRKSLASGEIKNHFESTLQNNSDQFSQVPQNSWSIVEQSLKDMPQTIDEAYEIFFDRMGIHIDANGNRIYTDVKEVLVGPDKKGADAAIFHTLLYPPERLTVEDQVHILENLEKQLMRESGFIRYKYDWFLYGAPSAVESAGSLPLNPDMIAVLDANNKYVSSTREDRDQVYAEHQKQKYAKDMEALIKKTGDGLEAQWSFQDSMLAQIYLRLYNETGHQKFWNKAWFHLSRALAAVTDHGQITIEGKKAPAYRAPEAWIPVKLIHKGEVFTIYLASPNSPLNWTTAELLIALRDFIKTLPR